MTKVIITSVKNHKFVFIYENGILTYVYPFTDEHKIQIGDIYIGRVFNVVKNIQSAFIKLMGEEAGYLPLDNDILYTLNRRLPKGVTSIAQGDMVLVQVKHEPLKMKKAKVSGNINLTGTYVLIDCQAKRIGISKKIKNEERKQALMELAHHYMINHTNFHGISDRTEADRTETDRTEADLDFFPYGIVFRTACDDASNDLIMAELDQLCNELNEIMAKAEYEKNPGLIKKGEPDYISVLNEYGVKQIDEIITDLPDILEELTKKGLPVQSVSDDERPLYRIYGLETELDHILSKKVWLKSGGFLIIEPTEAMVVIDVNTGKSIGKKNQEKHILKVNMEAAQEIARQIKLRNLSGIIMVDFINLELNASRLELISFLSKELAKDKVSTHFVDVTKLELYEITRKKLRKPIYEVVRTK